MTQVSHHCLPLNHCEIFFKPWHHLAFALEECTVYTLFSPLFLSPAPAIIKVKLQDTNDAVINVHIYIWILQMTSKVFTLIFLLGCHWNKNTRILSQAQWCLPVVPATQVDGLSPGVQYQPGWHNKTPSSKKQNKQTKKNFKIFHKFTVPWRCVPGSLCEKCSFIIYGASTEPSSSAPIPPPKEGHNTYTRSLVLLKCFLRSGCRNQDSVCF